MNSSSREPATRQVPPPPHSREGSCYSRFIPREELQDFAAWAPEVFGNAGSPAWAQPPGPPGPFVPAQSCAGTAHAAPAAPAMPPPTLAELRARMAAERASQVAEARAQGYQDGYRDGLVALDRFKQGFASQVSAQMAQVLASLDRELGDLEQSLAASVARVATELARQVVRSELSQRPALVAQVARDAVDAVLMSARHISVQVHPDDHALVAAGCQEALAARGARLLARPEVARGGCRVESDLGAVDASIGARWAQAAHALGSCLPWDEAAGGSAPAGACS